MEAKNSSNNDNASKSDPFSDSDFINTDNMSSVTDDTNSAAEDIGGPPTSKDYWFGKKYFQCVLAQELLRQTPPQESIQSMDSKLEIAIQRFSYQETVNMLRAQGIITSQMSLFNQQSTSFETLMMLIGSICRQGGRKEKRALSTAIRRGETTLGFGHKHETESPKSRERDHQGIPLSDANEPLADIGFYTLILKEHGDKIGINPSYDTETITLVPPKFATTLSFNGSIFRGYGSTKKEAKHTASRRACESLRLKLR